MARYATKRKRQRPWLAAYATERKRQRPQAAGHGDRRDARAHCRLRAAAGGATQRTSWASEPTQSDSLAMRRQHGPLSLNPLSGGLGRMTCNCGAAPRGPALLCAGRRPRAALSHPPPGRRCPELSRRAVLPPASPEANSSSSSPPATREAGAAQAASRLGSRSRMPRRRATRRPVRRTACLAPPGSAPVAHQLGCVAAG